MPDTPGKEHPSTYFVEDRSSEPELERLRIQDQMLTNNMGGVLPEQPDPTIFRSVLDVGCGTGGWLIQTARTYPRMTLLVGIDANKKLIDYARAQARVLQVDDRVKFYTMDALRMLEFPDDSFDLINQRLGVSYLRTWDWPKLLNEYQRVGRWGATIRITESDINHANTPAFTQLSNLFLQVMALSGHFVTPSMDATLTMLPSLLGRHGFQHVQTRHYSFGYRPGTFEGDLFVENMKHGFRNIVPFFHKWTRVPDNYEELYQQMVEEMKQPDFVGEWNFVTAWGLNLTKVPGNNDLYM